MIQQLPDWYRVASLKQESVETFKSRSSVIVSIVKSMEIERLFNCVRAYLNKPYDHEFKIDLIRMFTEKDPLFPQTDNQLEIRVLCGAILYKHIVIDDFDGSISLALSLVSLAFTVTDVINSDIIDGIKMYLRNKSIDLRELPQNIDLREGVEKILEVEGVAEADETPVIPQTIDSLKVDIDNSYTIPEVNRIFRFLHNRLSVLDEESNIHWWIFRGHSNFKNIPIKELNVQIAPLVLGKELSDLTRIIPGPPSSDQFFMKILSDHFQGSYSDTVSIKDAINDLVEKDKESIVANFVSAKLGNLCPLMFACNEAAKVGDNSSWLRYFETETKVSPKSKISRIDLAKQFYIENLLIKSLD